MYAQGRPQQPIHPQMAAGQMHGHPGLPQMTPHHPAMQGQPIGIDAAGNMIRKRGSDMSNAARQAKYVLSTACFLVDMLLESLFNRASCFIY